MGFELFSCEHNLKHVGLMCLNHKVIIVELTLRFFFDFLYFPDFYLFPVNLKVNVDSRILELDVLRF